MEPKAGGAGGRGLRSRGKTWGEAWEQLMSTLSCARMPPSTCTGPARTLSLASPGARDPGMPYVCEPGALLGTTHVALHFRSGTLRLREK